MMGYVDRLPGRRQTGGLMRPQPGADADMYDAFTNFRYWLNWKAGERKAIKRRASRVVRRTAKVALRRDRESC